MTPEQPSPDTDKRKELTPAKIGLISAVAVAVIGVVGTIISAYISSQAARAPVIIPIQATQTAEARLLSTEAARYEGPTYAIAPTQLPSARETVSLSPTSLLPTAVTSAAISRSTMDTTSSTVITTEQGGSPQLGSLTVTIPDACGVVDFSIKDGDRVAGSGETGRTKLVAEGIYDVVLELALNSEYHLVRNGVTVQAGKEALVDFGSEELGVLDLTLSLPEVKDVHWSYMLYDENHWWAQIWNLAGSHFTSCLKPGVYTISLEPVDCNALGQNCVRYGILDGSEVTPIEAEIRAQETTTVTSDAWAKALGFLSFTSKDTVGIEAEIFRIQDGKYIPTGVLSSGSVYWMLPGNYNIVLRDPYVNVRYDNVEIRAGEKTDLSLPEASLP